MLMYLNCKKTVKILLLLLFANTLFLYSQENDTLIKEKVVKDTLAFKFQVEDSLKILFDSLYQQDNLHNVNAFSTEISSIFDTMLLNKKTFTYPFDSLK